MRLVARVSEKNTYLTNCNLQDSTSETTGAEKFARDVLTHYALKSGSNKVPKWEFAFFV